MVLQIYLWECESWQGASGEDQCKIKNLPPAFYSALGSHVWYRPDVPQGEAGVAFPLAGRAAFRWGQPVNPFFSPQSLWGTHPHIETETWMSFPVEKLFSIVHGASQCWDVDPDGGFGLYGPKGTAWQQWALAAHPCLFWRQSDVVLEHDHSTQHFMPGHSPNARLPSYENNRLDEFQWRLQFFRPHFEVYSLVSALFEVTPHHGGALLNTRLGVSKAHLFPDWQYLNWEKLTLGGCNGDIFFPQS